MPIFLHIFLIMQCLLNIYSFVSEPHSKEIINTTWDKETLEKANTTANAEYLTQAEKDIIFYTNLARLNGPLFAETYVQKFMDQKKLKPSKYDKSLKSDLKKSKPMAPIHPQKDLSEIAQGHAFSSGKKGLVGHHNFNNRIKPVMTKYKSLGENCQYGYDDGLSIVMDLLIDEGIEDLGHRKNILNPAFENVGVSIQPHKKYAVNSVMIYGGAILEKK
jgi:hypothetical protein